MIDVAIVFLPLLGALIAGLGYRRIGDLGAQIVTCVPLLIAAVLSAIVFVDVTIGGNARTTELFTWFDSGGFEASWSLRVWASQLATAAAPACGSAAAPPTKVRNSRRVTAPPEAQARDRTNRHLPSGRAIDGRLVK